MLISLSEGKYHVENNNGILKAYRNNEPWNEMTESLIGNKFVLSLVNKIEELEEIIDDMIEFVE